MCSYSFTIQLFCLIKVRAGRLTVVEGVSVLQSSQLLEAGMQDPRPVTRHRQSQRLPVCSYRPCPLLAPVGRRKYHHISLDVR